MLTSHLLHAVLCSVNHLLYIVLIRDERQLSTDAMAFSPNLASLKEMGECAMRFESRKYTRFLAEEDVYAALGINFTKVGKIKDISIGGLAFEYIDCTENCVQDFSIVAIFHSHNEFHLPNLACRLICNLAISAEIDDSQFIRQYAIHRCAIQFGDITENQRKQLEFFINHYTCGMEPLYPIGEIPTK